MKQIKLLLGACIATSSFCVLANNPAPVLEIGAKGAKANVSLSQQLSTLERKLDARNRAQIAIQTQLDDLQTEVNELRGVTELHSHQLQQILERQRELYQELDRRVSEALKTKNTVPETLAVAESTPESVNYSNDLNENESYDRAVNLVLKDKRYEQAINEFRSFIKKFPQSSYAANAHYWLGQLLFNKGKYDEAKQEFTVVVSQYKDSNKRSDALLKLATVAQKQNNNSRAIVLYKQVISEYANSSAAQLASSRLEALTSHDG